MKKKNRLYVPCSANNEDHVFKPKIVFKILFNFYLVKKESTNTQIQCQNGLRQQK